MLTELEKKIFNDLLDMFSDQLGNAGCNDLAIPNTEEGRELFKNVEAFCIEHESDRREPLEEETLYTMDFMVLAYLRNKIGL